MSWYERFSRNYPEAFRVEEKMGTDSESNKGETRPKKPSLDGIRKRLMDNRMAERFANYEGVMSDPNLSLTEKRSAMQLGEKFISLYYRDIYFKVASIDQRKPIRKTLEEVKIKRVWAQFLLKLYKLVLNYNQLQYCTGSLCFIHNNFKVIEEICNSEPTTGNELGVGLRNGGTCAIPLKDPQVSSL